MKIFPRTSLQEFEVLSMPSKAMFLPNAQKTECIIAEDKTGAMLNRATGKPWMGTDPCNRVGADLAYSVEATAATDKAVLGLLGTVFKVKHAPRRNPRPAVRTS